MSALKLTNLQRSKQAGCRRCLWRMSAIQIAPTVVRQWSNSGPLGAGFTRKRKPIANDGLTFRPNETTLQGADALGQSLGLT